MPWCLLLHAGEPGIRPGSVDVSDRCYELMRYVRSPPSGLKDSTSYPAFFMAPAMKPRTVCFSQPIFSMISANVAPLLRWSMATTWAVLLPSRGALAPVAASLAVVSLVALAFFGAPLAAVGAALAFLGLAAGGGAGSGCPDLDQAAGAPVLGGVGEFFLGREGGAAPDGGGRFRFDRQAVVG